MPDTPETGEPTETLRSGRRSPSEEPAGREFTVAVLDGDGIGPEVTREAVRVLGALESSGKLRTADDQPVHLWLEHMPFGGQAVDQCGEPLPAETWEACRSAAAVLLGAVGGPRWESLQPRKRPEAGLLDLRRRLGAFANLRPIRRWVPGDERPYVQSDIDFLIVRELTGGIYFGEPRGTVTEANGTRRAYDTMVYSEPEVERLVRRAFEAARGRKGRLTSVDKENVLASSRLWRDTVNRVAHDYPAVQLDHQYVDSFTIRMVRQPESLDVVATGNLFGDILSDLGGGIVGTIGVLPSASLGDGSLPGIFEPVHGSAPDIAGRGEANPLGTILAAAMMLRYGLGFENGARVIERAVEAVLGCGLRTPDMPDPTMSRRTSSAGSRKTTTVVDTAQMGQAVADAIETRS